MMSELNLSMVENEVDQYPQSSRFQKFEGGIVDHNQGDKVVKLWFFLAVTWFAVFTTFGLLLAIKFFFPTFFGSTSWLTFGVVRPAHVNGCFVRLSVFRAARRDVLYRAALVRYASV